MSQRKIFVANLTSKVHGDYLGQKGRDRGSLLQVRQSFRCGDQVQEWHLRLRRIPRWARCAESNRQV